MLIKQFHLITSEISFIFANLFFGRRNNWLYEEDAWIWNILDFSKKKGVSFMET